ncbi:glycosyltransferase family 4 protein [Paracoccus sp. M683]|uniref:glycosyltransferase family 4 protein n=1 Tax=Paracoccus sp. M683 TaxID=2594268 RepID=UPI00117D06CE|nr:glycosyltransferase family 4 protein [Paracoccus sp. M683]TRW98860.1 glycosyltransferase family 4 protein [Paracoccus sp. M683]
MSETPLVIAPNLKRRLSGVTATVVRLVPLQARMIPIRATGPGLPPEVPHIPLIRAATLPRDRWRVWHARRNTEMLLGLALRHVLRRKYRLLFTSASQRAHSGYTKWLINGMDALVATSAKGAAYLDHPATVIHHGIDTDGFAPPADREALRARLNLPAGQTLVGCYGRIRARKGTGDFVHAMLALLPSRPQVTALVMGRATEQHTGYLSDLKAQVAAAGLSDRILFLPEVTVDRMADWYGALDLYVAPQRWEGFGLTPLEAMACGVPVVATRVGAFEELLTPDTGTLIAPEDGPALQSAIARWLDDPAAMATAGRAARAHTIENHGIEVEARALVAIYRDLLDRAP